MSVKPFRILIAFAIFFAILFLVSTAPPIARAASYVVTKTADTNDGTCDADCSLREAITEANANIGADTITFNIPDTDGGCSGANDCTITLSALNTLPAIDDDVMIDGAPNNGNITISGAYSYRVMMVNSGKTLSLNALTIANGYVISGFAGGIWNYGTLNLTNSTLDTNYAGSGAGGILNEGGTLNIAGSTFNGNYAGSGGGVYNYGGTVNIANSTFSGNFASNGGAVFILGPGTSTNITNSTLSGNYAGSGGAIFNTDTLNLKNSIITNTNTGGDCDNSGTITGSNNLIDDTTCGSSASFRLGAVTNFDTTLANNGGRTQTFKLNVDSNAINAVPAGECTYVSSGTNPLFNDGDTITIDQRGETRPQGLFCDIGAYELVYTGFQTGPNFVVNNAADTNDNSCDILGQGIGNQDCTLREAIHAANTPPASADTITFDILDTGADCLSDNVCTITLGSMLPIIDDDVTIDGSANFASITLTAINDARVLAVNSGKTATLETLTIADSACVCDGVIRNEGGILNVRNSTFSGNHANGPGSPGGAIQNYSGTLNVTNTTFSNNVANGSGGAIENNDTLNVTNSTFSGNSATSGGGIFTLSGSATLKNTIIANSTSGGDCVLYSGTVTGNNNLLEDGSTACGLTNGTNGNIVGVDPALGALANNGGPTQTMALGNSSVAIDAGDDTVCADNATVNNLDQRGEPRNDLQCDIGAFEFVNSDGHTIAKNNFVFGPLYTFGPTLAGITSGNTFNDSLAINREIPGTHPGTPPANALTITWDATTSGSGYSFLVTLCYDPNDPSQYNGQTESALHVWHYNGSTWDDLGGTLDTTTHAPYHCVTATNALTSLSPLILAPTGTTAVNVAGVKASINQKGNVVVKWRTTTESQIAGFNVFRKTGKGEWKQVNANFIQAKHAGSTEGNKYRFADKQIHKAKTYRYKIEVKYLDNHSEWTKVVRVKMP